MKLFEMSPGGIPIIAPEVAVIDEFKRLLIRDRSVGKTKAFKELAYIYNMCDYKPPYAGWAEDEKHNAALDDAGLPDDWRPDTEVKEAMKKYCDRQDGEMIQLLMSAKKMISKLRIFFNSLNLDERDDKGKYINSPKDIMANISGLGKMQENLTILEGLVRKEEQKSSRQRGNAIKGDFEDPNTEPKLLTEGNKSVPS